MRKAVIAAAVAAAVGILAVGLANEASAHKYKKAREGIAQTQTVASAEKVRSMDDCMSYSANHVSKGHAADRKLFQRQFGTTVSKNGAKSTYNYDGYTYISLDCSRRLCSCRCVSK